MKRRKSTAPINELGVLNERIATLEQKVKRLTEARSTSLQADSIDAVAEPAPWEVMVNHPGTHIDAEPTDPMVYYHPGQITPLVTAGWKRVGVPPTPRIGSWCFASHSFVLPNQNVITPTWTSALIASNLWPTDYEVRSGGTSPIRILKNGIYLISASITWQSSWGELRVFQTTSGVTGSVVENHDAYTVNGHMIPERQYFPLDSGLGTGGISFTIREIWNISNIGTAGPALNFRNDSGADRTVAAAMQIHCIGEYIADPNP